MGSIMPFPPNDTPPITGHHTPPNTITWEASCLSHRNFKTKASPAVQDSFKINYAVTWEASSFQDKCSTSNDLGSIFLSTSSKMDPFFPQIHNSTLRASSGDEERERRTANQIEQEEDPLFRPSYGREAEDTLQTWIMSSSSNMSGIENDYLRFRNKTCGCGTRAAVRIFESERNPGRLFYGCPKEKNGKEKCSYWREWCNPVGYHQPMPNVAEDEELVNGVNLKKINARVEVIQVAVDKLKNRVTAFMFIISLASIILLLK